MYLFRASYLNFIIILYFKIVNKYFKIYFIIIYPKTIYNFILLLYNYINEENKIYYLEVVRLLKLKECKKFNWFEHYEILDHLENKQINKIVENIK